MMSLNNSRRSGALYALVAGSLMASEISAQAPAPEVGDALQTAEKYATSHGTLANLFPEPYKTTCLQETEFVSNEALAIANACKDSLGADAQSWIGDCSPECAAYYGKLGGDCELLEEAAKAQVASAYQRGQLTTAETEALFAYYNYFKARYYNATTSATPENIVEHLEEYKNQTEGYGPAFLAKLANSAENSSPKNKLAYMDKCGYNYTAALGSEEALRGAVGASSAVRATALAGVAFFFAALV